MQNVAILVPLLLVGIGAAIDLRTREISDLLPVGIVVWGLMSIAFRWTPLSITSAAYGVTIGIIVGLLFFASGGFGGGDVKLIAALGLTLGAAGLVWVVLFMALAGGVLALIAKARGEASLAYGPAIAIGLLAYDVRFWLTS